MCRLAGLAHALSQPQATHTSPYSATSLTAHQSGVIVSAAATGDLRASRMASVKRLPSRRPRLGSRTVGCSACAARMHRCHVRAKMVEIQTTGPGKTKRQGRGGWYGRFPFSSKPVSIAQRHDTVNRPLFRVQSRKAPRIKGLCIRRDCQRF